jgi:hypothetical protein
VITRVRASDLDLAVPASPTSVPQVREGGRSRPQGVVVSSPQEAMRSHVHQGSAFLSVVQVVSAIRTHPGEKLTFTVERKVGWGEGVTGAGPGPGVSATKWAEQSSE